MAAERVYELEVRVNSFTIDDVDGTESLLRVEALRRQCTAKWPLQPFLAAAVVGAVAALLPFGLHDLLLVAIAIAISLVVSIAIPVAIATCTARSSSSSSSITTATATATATGTAVHLLDRLQLAAGQRRGAIAIGEIRLEILAELLLLRNALNARAGEFSHIRWLQFVCPLPDLAQADGRMEAIEDRQRHRHMRDDGPSPQSVEVQLYGMRFGA